MALHLEVMLMQSSVSGEGTLGFDVWKSVEREARLTCELCKCKENACYDRLKSYGNQSHHDILDRRIVVDFFK